MQIPPACQVTVFLLMSAASFGVPTAAAAQRANVPAAQQEVRQPGRQGTTVDPGEQLTAQETRRQLEELFRRYPPEVGQVLKLDPSLMSSQAYLAPYPLLGEFLSRHPEVTHNPSYYLESFSGQPEYRNDPRWHARQDLFSLLGGLAAFTAFMMVLGVLVWLIRLLVGHRRWNRLSKVQFEAHNKLLDRFTANDELLAYVQTPAGRRFLESAPIPTEDAPGAIAAPLSRILWSVQAGIVLMVVGLGLLQIARGFTDEAAQFFSVAGTLALALGAGFIVSAIAAYALSRRMGLLDRPAADHA